MKLTTRSFKTKEEMHKYYNKAKHLKTRHVFTAPGAKTVHILKIRPSKKKVKKPYF